MPYVHHTVLHFVIGMAFLPPLFGALAWARGDARWSRELRLLVYLLVGAALLSVGSGLLSANHVIEGGMDARQVYLHRNLALGATAVWLLLAGATFFVARSDLASRYKMLTVATAFGTLCMSFAAHFGGEMLHPGMAPWSSAEHKQMTPGGASGAHDEGGGDDGAAPTMSAMPDMPDMPDMAPSASQGK